MGLKTSVKKHDELNSETALAWEWVRKLPEYTNDFMSYETLKSKKSKTLLSESPAEIAEPYFRKRWGFYPLQNPATTLPRKKGQLLAAPLNFMVDVGRLFGFHPLDSGITARGVTFTDLICLENKAERKRLKRKCNYEPPKKLPKRIAIELDPTRHVSSLVSEVRDYLKRVQAVYNVKTDKKEREHGLHTRYQAYVQRQLGLPDTVNKRLLKKEYKYRNGVIAEDSERKAIDRILKKSKEVSDKKV